MYFLAPRKCSIFGVCCEGIPLQYNYLIDEAVDCGKGGNSVCSMLHHFFNTHSLGEKRVHLHADNCCGQNKNNIVLQVSCQKNLNSHEHATLIFFFQYLIWRVLVGLHESITYSFLPVGHTKFAPDWCFGLLKQKYRKTKISSLSDFVDVVQTSATSNMVQLVGSQEGDVIVPFYDWNEHLSPYFSRLEGIKRYQHFTITSTDFGTVKVKQFSSDTETKEIKLLKQSWKPSAKDLPEVVTPKGLSSKRRWYFYDKIREYCSEDSKDLVCPRPHVPRECSVPPELSPPPSPSFLEQLPPPPKKSRICGNCGAIGHNRRSCKDL